MKRKYGDGASWKRLIEKSYTVKQVEEECSEYWI